MGYKNERNRGLAEYFDENPNKDFWNGLGDNIVTRFFSGGARSVDDIVRGIGRAGGAVFTDAAEVVKEPLGAALESAGLLSREKREASLGPAGWWTQVDPTTGESTGRRASTYSDVLLPVGKSFLNTGRLVDDLTNPVRWAATAVNPEHREAHLGRLSERVDELATDPFNFTLEHVGNVALTGAVAAKPAQLGIASSRGAITGAQAARGLRPLAGRGVRSTAREATRQAAAEGSRAARMTLFADDVIGHPYRSTWNKAKGSYPAQLFRNPIDRATASSRFAATIDRMRLSEEGSFDFRKGDLRRDWNEAAEEFNRAAGRPSNDAARVYPRARLRAIAEDMRSRGMEPPEFTELNRRAPKIDPNEVALREPDAVETIEDFRWLTDEPGDAGGAFTRGLIDSVDTEVEILGKDRTPDSIQATTFGSSRTAVAYYVDKSGRVAGAVEVDPYSGINIAVDPSARGKNLGQSLLEKVAAEFPDMDWETALKNTTTSEFGTRLQERMRQRMAAGDVEINLEAQGKGYRSVRERTRSPHQPQTLEEVFAPLSEPPVAQVTQRHAPGSLVPPWEPPTSMNMTVEARLNQLDNNGSVIIGPRHPSYDEFEYLTAYRSDLTLNDLVDYDDFRAASEARAGGSTTQPSSEARTFSQAMRGLFAEEVGSVANPFAGRGPRPQGNSFGPIDMGFNEAGLLRNRVLDSELGQRFSEDARRARQIVRDRNAALRSGEGPIASRALNALGTLRGRGVRGVNIALDASTTEAKFLRGIHNLGKRLEGADYPDLINELDLGGPSGVGDRLSNARDVASGRRAIGSNLPADKLVDNIYKVLETARKRSANAESISDEVGRIIPGVDAESLSLLALDAIEKAEGLPQGSLQAALGDYVQGDTFLLDTNRRAQALMGDQNNTPSRFRLTDDELAVDLESLPQQYQEIFYEAARQRRITQRFMEEAKAQAPGGSQLFNTRSGTRIGVAADEATQFGVNADYLNEVLGVFDQSLDDFGGDVDAAMDALDDLQDEFFDVDVHTIRQGNATQAQKNRIKRKQKEFEQAQRERTELLEEIEKIQSREKWTTRDWERHAELQAASKTNLNQVITAAARLGKLRNTVAGSLEAAPVSARNVLLYAREVVPEQISTLEKMLDDGVGDPKAIKEVIEDLKATPRTLDELNEAQTFVSYLKDVRDIPRQSVSGATGSATRSPALRRRGTNTDATYVRDMRARLLSQDMDFQRKYVAKVVQDTVKEKGLSRSGAEILDRELGYTPDEIKKMTTGQIQDALSHGGYRAYEPDSLFETRRAPQGDPLEAQWVRQDVGEILTRGVRGENWADTMLQATYDKVLRGWKVVALPLRPAWQINNIFGNALLTMLRGQVSPADYMQLFNASRQAVSEWNQGLARTIEIPLAPRYVQELQDMLPSLKGQQRALVQAMLDDGSLKLDNTILNEISSNGLIQGDLAFLNNSQFFRTLMPHEQGFLRRTGIRQAPPRMPKNLEELGDVNLFERTKQRSRNLRATGREFVDYAYHLNETVDNFHRTLIYLDRMRKGSSHAEAISAVNKTLGDYNRLSDFERRWVRRVYPFWPWMRHMLETVTRSLSPDDIGRTTIFAHLTSLFGEANEYEELLPDYAAGDIFMGIGPEGTPKFMSTRGLNPFLDVFDPITQPNMRGLTRPMSPMLTMFEEQRTGVSNLTGREFSSPVRPADGSLPRPPVSEQIWRNIPQANAARNIYRDLTGQPLTRYGTGEPAIFPGAERDKSGLTSLTQLFGVNVRPMDVQQMKAREKLELFREATEMERQKAKERAYNESNTRSLGNLFMPGR